ncbi:MAG: exodeoxyribonuclease VII large subunit [Candidatus Dasytiphilus stammeri]
MSPISLTVFTVTNFNKKIQQLLKDQIGPIWLTAEVSNFSQPSSGHWYFTLKDHASQIRCVIFRSYNRSMSFCPRNGQQILIHATITIYEYRGDLQLIADSIHQIGDGLLHQQYEQLRTILSSEGLFAQHFKKSLPRPAHQVGLITSTTGAALYDMLRILKRRDPLLPIVIYPAIVQGDTAPSSVIGAIELANIRKECDVLILGRGGGSLEDLWCFNDEKVARAIFASSIPIVSAIGHETDITIADLVSDLRAPTPSAAAEIVSRNNIELLRQIHLHKKGLEIAIQHCLEKQQSRFTDLNYQLQRYHPQLYFLRQGTYLNKIFRKIYDLIFKKINLSFNRQRYTENRLLSYQIQSIIDIAKYKLQQLQYKLPKIMNGILTSHRHKILSIVSQLEVLSPRNTLTRGYSMTMSDNILITNIDQLKNKDTIKVIFLDGYAICKITSYYISNKHLSEHNLPLTISKISNSGG